MLKPAHSKALSCLTILCAGLFAWMTACLITGTAYPVMVVSSESMEPTFYRGDLILLWNRRHTLRAGDIPVVWFDGYPRPMVHRAIKVFDEEINEGPLTRTRQLILTQGDNNAVDDTSLYPRGQSFVYRENVIGLVYGHVPYVGTMSLGLKDIAGPSFLSIVAAGLIVYGLIA
ncbi:hypothetical protein POX_c03586 [Penicillium oxalicum]|uniref:hypothetical protein n=1 Tax=Penicillium oxalicum TaxID=69781 RepID=UPI0020B75FDF|nr:hypothetical protein POX_c03586 [Penicillium oxalicum]KAI2790738.1 hypothetical protein POX_c03586 [Penicillium oxalicum]